MKTTHKLPFEAYLQNIVELRPSTIKCFVAQTALNHKDENGNSTPELFFELLFNIGEYNEVASYSIQDYGIHKFFDEYYEQIQAIYENASCNLELHRHKDIKESISTFIFDLVATKMYRVYQNQESC